MRVIMSLAIPAQAFDLDGYAIVDDILSAEACTWLSGQVDALPVSSAGSREILEHEWAQRLAIGIRANHAFAQLVAPNLVAVQCTLFNKSDTRNWGVPYHQDLSVPVAEQVIDPRLTAWSQKEGRWFVQPPAALLDLLVAVRVHLDPCPLDAGALRVIPGTHRRGRLSEVDVRNARDNEEEVACVTTGGGALVLRPLLLHASSKLKPGYRRRVLHFVFGPRELPFGLRWAVCA